MRKTIRLYKVLRACEAHRIKTEKENKKKKREKRKKDLEEYRVWNISEEKNQEEKKEKKEEDGPALPQKILKLLFTSYGGMACLFLLLFFAGCIRGLWYSEEIGMAKIAVEYKWWFLLAELLILVQVLPGIRNKLYYEKDLLFLMTMPFEPMEVVMAKYLQVLPLAYRIMGLLVLPAWLGFSLVIGFGNGLTVAVLVACLVIPLFELQLLFMLVILWHIYTRKFVRQSPLISIGAPLVLGLVALIVITLLEIMFRGRVVSGILQTLEDMIVFNFAWEMMIQGSLLLPLLFIVISCVLAGMLFSMTTRYLYRKSLLCRWDLAGEGSDSGETCKKTKTVHGPGIALVLRELRTIKGIKIYAIPNFFSCFLLPVFLLLLFACLESFSPLFALNESRSALDTFSILAGFVAALTLATGCMNKPAATAFSRDAHERIMLFLMPVENDQRLKVKLVAGLWFALLGSTPYVLVSTVFLIAQGKIPFWGLLVALYVNLCFVVMTTCILMIREILKPNFAWKEARELVDTNGNLGYLLVIAACILFPIIFSLLVRFSEGKFLTELIFLLFILLLVTVLPFLFLLSMNLKKVCQPPVEEIKKERKRPNFLKKIKSRVDTKRKNIV